MAETLNTAEAGPGARKSRRPLAIVLSVLIGIAVLVGLFFVADAIARGVAERRVAEEIVAQLPTEVVASPTVHIGGTSVIMQYLGGSFEDITVSAPDAVIDGIPADVTVHASGFPVDATQPVDSVTATATLDQAALNSLVDRTAPNSAVELGQGELSYAAEASFFGFSVGYRVTGTLQAAGDRVLVTPTGAEITSEAGNLDLSRVVDLIVGSEPITVCTASHLPVGVEVTAIDVEPGTATVRLEAHNIVLDESTLSTLGSCAP